MTGAGACLRPRVVSGGGAATAGGWKSEGCWGTKVGSDVFGTSLNSPEALTSAVSVSLNAVMKRCASPAPRKSGIAIAGTRPPVLSMVMRASWPVRRHRAPDNATAKQMSFFIAMSPLLLQLEQKFDFRLILGELRRQGWKR